MWPKFETNNFWIPEKPFRLSAGISTGVALTQKTYDRPPESSEFTVPKSASALLSRPVPIKGPIINLFDPQRALPEVWSWHNLANVDTQTQWKRSGREYSIATFALAAKIGIAAASKQQVASEKVASPLRIPMVLLSDGEGTRLGALTGYRGGLLNAKGEFRVTTSDSQIWMSAEALYDQICAFQASGKGKTGYMGYFADSDEIPPLPVPVPSDHLIQLQFAIHRKTPVRGTIQKIEKDEKSGGYRLWMQKQKLNSFSAFIPPEAAAAFSKRDGMDWQTEWVGKLVHIVGVVKIGKPTRYEIEITDPIQCEPQSVRLER